MKKTTIHRYRISEEKEALTGILSTILTDGEKKETSFLIDANGKKNKTLERVWIDDKLQLDTVFKPNGDIESQEGYFYNDQGKLAKKTRKDRFGKILHYQNFHFDENGKLVFIDMDDRFLYIIESFYQESYKRVVKETAYDKEQPWLADCHWETIFIKGQKRIERTYESFEATEEGFYPDGNYNERRYEYNENGTLKQVTSQIFQANSTNSAQRIARQEEYDENGLLLKVILGTKDDYPPIISTYQYEFDQSMNWVERKTYRNGVFSERAIRTIEGTSV